MAANVIIRADASGAIGTGHIMRCLSLADELASCGYCIIFISRLLEGNLRDYIIQRGYPFVGIPSTAPLERLDVAAVEQDAQYTVQLCAKMHPDWLIVDHYALDEQWEVSVKPHAGKLMVIDDLADRRHSADLLLDQNLSSDQEYRYRNLVPDDCKMLLGPSYLLLRPSFYEQRAALRRRGEEVKRLLVFFGGSDPTNETLKALKALNSLTANSPMDTPLIHTDVVIGTANPRLEEIKQFCDEMTGVALHIQIENMAELIAAADFALGAGGVAMWERCYLGLPSAVAVVAENQADTVALAGQLGAVIEMGWHGQINSEQYADILNKACGSIFNLGAMGTKALELMGSQPGQKQSRVITVITEERLRDERHSHFGPHNWENT
ncbi:UDP-2,4-diacetamido-2,4,6-trideoxy-beta-L-altropyranose hydrolase [Paenibacillus sp. FSL H8-0537]|uniref:UDP-2,4-diacetamido-2,4, 6-trideoxy-beta-L-altropyranose hydrolase n=1 Tax=Paenibacillus sp. FSL H8-0537 TaxID=2921399 RepID=UPI003101A8EA